MRPHRVSYHRPRCLPSARAVLHPAMLLTAFAACGGAPDADDRTPDATGPAIVCSPPAADELHARADSLVALLVHGLTTRDADLVAPLLAPPGFPPEPAEAAVGMAALLDHLAGEVTDCVALPAQPPADYFEYRLLSSAGAGKSIVVLYDRWRDEMRVFDEFLGYYPRGRRYAERIVEAIRARDALRLARLLSVDDIDYPDTLAVTAIGNYEAAFDLGSLRLSFDGLEPEPRTDYGPDVNRWFRFRIFGSRPDGTPADHPVLLAHGDGLFGWRDPLVPEYHGY